MSFPGHLPRPPQNLFGLFVVAFLVVGGCDGGGDAPAESIPTPTGLEATSQDGAVSLTWQDVGTPGYNVYRDTTSMSTVSGTPVNGATPVRQPSFVDESVENGTRYFYRVTAVEEGRESDPSAEVAVRPFPEPPPRP